MEIKRVKVFPDSVGYEERYLIRLYSKNATKLGRRNAWVWLKNLNPKKKVLRQIRGAKGGRSLDKFTVEVHEKTIDDLCINGKYVGDRTRLCYLEIEPLKRFKFYYTTWCHPVFSRRWMYRGLAIGLVGGALISFVSYYLAKS